MTEFEYLMFQLWKDKKDTNFEKFLESVQLAVHHTTKKLSNETRRRLGIKVDKRGAFIFKTK